MYNEARPFIKSGDAITWEGKGFISWAISLWSKRTHASLVVRPPEFQEWMHRRFLVEAWEGEVNMRLLSYRLKQYSGKAYWHKLRSQFEPFREDIEDYALSRLGTLYDYKGLFGNMFGHISNDAKKYICSEFVGDVYLKTVEKKVLMQAGETKDMTKLLKGIALRPAGISRLPIYEPEVRIL